MKHYILKGRKVVEVDLVTWSEFLRSPERIIKQETTPNGYWVSTVFLGIDHNFYQDDCPVIFETMVFKDGENYTQERYRTYSEAEAGHKRIAEEFSNKTNDSN